MTDLTPEDEFDETPSASIRVERLLAIFPEEHPLAAELRAIRDGLHDQEMMIDEARTAIEKLEKVVEKVTSPANRVGTFLTLRDEKTAQIVVGGSDYYCLIDPRLDVAQLKTGMRVLVNEAYVIVGDLGFDRTGQVVKITELIDEDRLRIGGEHGQTSSVLLRSAELVQSKLKAGDEVRVDGNFRVAIEMLTRSETKDFYLETVPELAWDQIGGQKEALGAIRDAIELPLLHTELFSRFKHATPKGFLLHGPPGCGKTLIGKATAYNLTKQLNEKTGRSMEQYFMHIKGPEILNMWLGESERIVREIFATAREKRKEGFLPFLFIDEAESILGTRRASRSSNILSTLVPMFCTEMDGIESLSDIVIILASNRADLIDPAILRPGRIDRKIKVHRPDREGAREIYRIYLDLDLPYDPALLKKYGSNENVVDYLSNRLSEIQYAHTDANRFLEISLRSGRKEILHRGDLASGALISSIVDRAKEIAIKRAIFAKTDEGISEADLLSALDNEYAENDLFPPGNIIDDWLKLIDYDSENVVRVRPFKAGRKETPSRII